MADTYEVGCDVTVKVVVNDPRVILRVTENRDAEDRPEGHPDWDEKSSWRKHLYADMTTRDDVLKMLAWNACANGVWAANRLDGWADLDDEAARTTIEDLQLDYVDQ